MTKTHAEKNLKKPKTPTRFPHVGMCVTVGHITNDGIDNAVIAGGGVDTTNITPTLLPI